MVQNKPGKRRWMQNAVLILCYFLLNLFLISRHEPWRDEGLAWLISDFLSPGELIPRTSVEGHSVVWFLLLMPLVKNGLPYYTMNLLSLGIMTIAALLLVTDKRLPFILKGLILLSPCYTYLLPVIARPYCLSGLAMAALARVYGKRKEKGFLYCLLIAFLIQTHLYVIFFAFILCFMYLLECIEGMRKGRAPRGRESADFKKSAGSKEGMPQKADAADKTDGSAGGRIEEEGSAGDRIEEDGIALAKERKKSFHNLLCLLIPFGSALFLVYELYPRSYLRNNGNVLKENHDVLLIAACTLVGLVILGGIALYKKGGAKSLGAAGGAEDTDGKTGREFQKAVFILAFSLVATYFFEEFVYPLNDVRTALLYWFVLWFFLAAYRVSYEKYLYTAGILAAGYLTLRYLPVYEADITGVYSGGKPMAEYIYAHDLADGMTDIVIAGKFAYFPAVKPYLMDTNFWDPVNDRSVDYMQWEYGNPNIPVEDAAAYGKEKFRGRDGFYVLVCSANDTDLDKALEEDRGRTITVIERQPSVNSDTKEDFALLWVSTGK